MPLGRDVVLLAHDANGVAALYKPAGLLSHPNAGGDEHRALLRAPYDLQRECYELSSPEAGVTGEGQVVTKQPAKKSSAGKARLWLLNRLDSATSGVLLVCHTEGLAESIRREFRNRSVHKTYVALVFGKPAQPSALWRDRLSVEKRGGQIRTQATRSGALSAECRVRVLRSGALHGVAGHKALSLLQLEPLTGRSHQLRVQCARRGLPIVGDATYGDFAANRAFAKTHGTKRLFLHSLETRFDYTWRDANYSFAATAPLPEAFGALL
ncbi:hypothetical protein AXK11_04710 [Cephaloticoccus primus]|uniref:Pseudouridine synthase RsuA/RluA-like domain-containing protein n=1 Tax=Cephaloticoccus primus TaxID=1548207 RepID=A0A139SN16_9BACT|nr:hypothetical protein AXK11_04710 [Cephaloticoccus primus]